MIAVEIVGALAIAAIAWEITGKKQLGWPASIAIALAIVVAIGVGFVAWYLLTCSSYTYCGGPL